VRIQTVGEVGLIKGPALTHHLARQIDVVDVALTNDTVVTPTPAFAVDLTTSDDPLQRIAGHLAARLTVAYLVQFQRVDAPKTPTLASDIGPGVAVVNVTD
jgi:hypothetical protein